MDVERMRKLYQNLRLCLSGIERLETRLNPDLLHNLASLYAVKAEIIDELQTDPPDEEFEQEPEDLFPDERAAMQGEIEGLKAQLDAFVDSAGDPLATRKKKPPARKKR